jgi:hypothetical protein
MAWKRPWSLHLFVDVEVGGGGGIKAGEQLIDHNQQAHLAGLFLEALFDQFLELLHPVHGPVFRLVEVVGQHFAVDGVLVQLLGFPFAGLFPFDVGGAGLIAGDDGALTGQVGFAKQFVSLAGLVDAGANQHGVAAPVHQPRLGFHVQQNVVDDHAPGATGWRARSASCPIFFQLGFGQLRKAASFGFKPLVYLLGGDKCWSMSRAS